MYFKIFCFNEESFRFFGKLGKCFKYFSGDEKVFRNFQVDGKCFIFFWVDWKLDKVFGEGYEFGVDCEIFRYLCLGVYDIWDFKVDGKYFLEKVWSQKDLQMF